MHRLFTSVLCILKAPSSCSLFYKTLAALRRPAALLAICSHAGSLLGLFNPENGAARSSETAVDFQWTEIFITTALRRVRGSVVGRGTMLQAGRSRVRFTNEVIGIFN
jgi:hypothetical protein